MKRFSLTMLAIVMVCGLLFNACSSTTKEDSETAGMARAKNLPIGVWTSGIAYSADRDNPPRPQWFKFIAPASVLYWHVRMLDSSSVNVYLNDSNGRFLEFLRHPSIGGDATTLLVTSGQVYYIEVEVRSLDSAAFFDLAITTSETPPPR